MAVNASGPYGDGADSGVYRIEVLVEPTVTYEDVALAPGDFREFILDPAGG